MEPEIQFCGPLVILILTHTHLSLVLALVGRPSLAQRRSPSLSLSLNAACPVKPSAAGNLLRRSLGSENQWLTFWNLTKHRPNGGIWKMIASPPVRNMNCQRPAQVGFGSCCDSGGLQTVSWPIACRILICMGVGCLQFEIGQGLSQTWCIAGEPFGASGGGAKRDALFV